MSKIEVNGNFHLLNKRGISPFEQEKAQEYRRKWEENAKDRIVDRFPLHLDIEATSTCNLRCPFCITTYANFKNGLLDFEVFKKIIDEGSEKGLYSMKLNWRGEPLIHPRFCEMVAYAKKKGIVDVFTNTNATFLTREKSKQIVESGIDRIIVSFEGYDKEFYEAQRVGAKFEQTVENVKGLIAVRNELNSPTPWVRVQTVLLDELKDKKEQYAKFWESIVDEVAYIDLKNEVERVAVGKNDWACPQLWQRLVIAWDGRVMPCVNDTSCTMSLGKVPEDSIEKIWKTKKLNDMRAKHDEGCAHEIEGCLDCPLRSAQVIKSDDMGM